MNAREEESGQARRETALKKIREKEQAHEVRRNRLKKQRAYYDKLPAELKLHTLYAILTLTALRAWKKQTPLPSNCAEGAEMYA